MIDQPGRESETFYTLSNSGKFTLNFLGKETNFQRIQFPECVCFEMRRTESRSRVWRLALIWTWLDQCHMNTDALEILQWECVSVKQTHASFSAVTRRRHLAPLFLCWPVFLFSLASVNTHTHTPAVRHSRSAPSLVGNLGGGLLFQSVYNWLDAALDAGRYAAGDGVGRGRSQGAGVPQTLLIPQLEKKHRFNP